jgi:UDP-N-acetyl-D-galactosamine dehydrogenase
MLENVKIVILGLGYVGLPLAVEFGKTFPCIGIDKNQKRLEKIKSGIDQNKELTFEEIKSSKSLILLSELKESLSYFTDYKNIYLITVPTKIDIYKKPDLSLLLEASREVGSILKKGDIVIYESTVFPGCTEEECVTILEKASGLQFNQDFYCGYSPERINPGDKINTLTKILKITSGSTVEVAELIDQLYKSIITAGTYKAPSMKVAEAAKLIENCQRDVNISFVNELALIFDRMNLDTGQVLEAAGTKWNFLRFQPGLVGGHCIGVDPYYMLHKSEQLGYYPALIGSGRRINDNMGSFVVNKVVKLMIKKNISIQGARVLILGITFKENCPDIRNTKVVDIYHELKEFGMAPFIFDPWAEAAEVQTEYDIELVEKPEGLYDVIIHAVSHDLFDKLSFKDLLKSNNVVFDVKSTLDKDLVDGRL